MVFESAVVVLPRSRRPNGTSTSSMLVRNGRHRPKPRDPGSCNWARPGARAGHSLCLACLFERGALWESRVGFDEIVGGPQRDSLGDFEPRRTKQRIEMC